MSLKGRQANVLGIVEYDYYQFLKGKYFHHPVVLVPMSSDSQYI